MYNAYKSRYMSQMTDLAYQTRLSRSPVRARQLTDPAYQTRLSRSPVRARQMTNPAYQTHLSSCQIHMNRSLKSICPPISPPALAITHINHFFVTEF